MCVEVNHFGLRVLLICCAICFVMTDFGPFLSTSTLPLLTHHDCGWALSDSTTGARFSSRAAFSISLNTGDFTESFNERIRPSPLDFVASRYIGQMTSLVLSFNIIFLLSF